MMPRKMKRPAKKTEEKRPAKKAKENRNIPSEDTVVFDCANGVTTAKKSVLVSGSQYFAAMFESDNEESRTNTVKFGKTSIEVMDIIIKHLSSQSLPNPSDISDELLRDLILEADKLQLTDLLDKYRKLYSQSEITSENFIPLWQLAHVLNKTDLRQELMTFLDEDEIIDEIKESDAFLNIDVSQLSNLITTDLLNKIDNWKMAELIQLMLSKEANAKDMLNLLSKFDLEKLQDEDLVDIIEKNLSSEVKILFYHEVFKRWENTIYD